MSDFMKDVTFFKQFPKKKNLYWETNVFEKNCWLTFTIFVYYTTWCSHYLDFALLHESKVKRTVSQNKGKKTCQSRVGINM